MGQPIQRFGARLRELRLKQGFDKKTIRSRTGISMSYLLLVEQGEQLPDCDKTRALAAVLGVSPDRLVEDRNRAELEELTQHRPSPPSNN